MRVGSQRTELDRLLVDGLIELYCSWKEECEAVHDAYERFRHASPGERTMTFAAYQAALDREAAAAESYGDQVVRVAARITLNPATAVRAGSDGGWP